MKCIMQTRKVSGVISSNEQQTLNFDLYMLLGFFCWVGFFFMTLCTCLTRPELSGLVAIEGQNHFPASSNHVSRS